MGLVGTMCPVCYLLEQEVAGEYLLGHLQPCLLAGETVFDYGYLLAML